MLIDPSLGAIVASGFVAVLLGMIWYHPKIFGSAWARLSGITPEMQERAKKRMPLMAIFGFIAALIVAYVMTYVSAAWGFYNWIGGLQLGFWCWAGFVAPTMLGMVLWEMKPFRLYLINALYWLLTLIIMAQFIVFAYGLQSMITASQQGANPDTGAYVQE